MENVIQQTRNYDKFSFIHNNREQNDHHIEALKIAFKEIGNLTKVQPILVNDKYQIIDGQHRFAACRELGQPIYYTMAEGLNVKDAQKLNITQKKWSLDDYVWSYALGGDVNYQRYRQLREDYGMSNAIILPALFGVADSKHNPLYKTLRKGEMVIDEETYEAARERLDKLAEAVEIIPALKVREPGRAFIKILGSDNYNHERMLTKLHGQKGKFNKYATLLDNLRQLEEFYNLNNRYKVPLF